MSVVSEYETVPVAVDDPDEYLAQLERNKELLAAVRTGEWLDQQEFPPLTYAIPGVIPEGFTVLAAAPKIGKSWFILSLCLAVASGGYALNALAVDQRKVPYLALEDGDRRLQERIRQLIPDEPISVDFAYTTRIEAGQVVHTIDAWLRRNPTAGLIVLDTLGKVMPPAKAGETTYQRDYNVGGRLKRITDAYPGLAVVVVHHDRKAESGDFVDAISGTNGIAGSADTIVLLTRARHETTGLLAVTGRDVQEAEYGLTRSETGSWGLTGGSLDAAKDAATQARYDLQLGRRGDRMNDVVDFVNSRPVTTPKEVDDLLGQPGQGKVYLSRALNAELIDKADKRGHYLPLTPPVTSVTVLPTEGNPPTGSNSGTEVRPPLGVDETPNGQAAS